ncbi:MAG: tryptophan--tRNA ligase [Verrucomicrobiota bacterium]
MRILSGIQPSGRPHLGNYFGMMQPSIELQNQGDAYYFIADFHALTSTHDPDELRQNVRELAIDFLACGLDPEKSTFWVQSAVPEVTELAWILSCVTPMGFLERCVSYKDKIAQGISPSHGLFAYPVLQAADILLFDSDVVPVGKDQKQHLELTRDVAGKFNDRYGEDLLVIPTPQIREAAATVPGLDGRKMSKSYGNSIEIFEDTEKALRKKIMKVVTDTTSVEDPKDPEGSYLIQLYSLVASPEQIQEMENSFRAGGVGYGHYKQQVFEAIRDHFAPMREKREELMKDTSYVDGVLEEGAKAARSKGREVLDRVRSAVGM